MITTDVVYKEREDEDRGLKCQRRGKGWIFDSFGLLVG